MKTFKQFMSESPSMSGPVGPNNPSMAGYVPKLFPHDTTPIDQGFQGPGAVSYTHLTLPTSDLV